MAQMAIPFATIAIDRWRDYKAVPPSLIGGPDAATAILSTVAASMVSLAALVLTITMVVVLLLFTIGNVFVVWRLQRQTKHTTNHIREEREVLQQQLRTRRT